MPILPPVTDVATAYRASGRVSEAHDALAGFSGDGVAPQALNRALVKRALGWHILREKPGYDR